MPLRFKSSEVTCIRVKIKKAVCPAPKRTPPLKNGSEPGAPGLSGAMLCTVQNKPTVTAVSFAVSCFCSVYP